MKRLVVLLALLCLAPVAAYAAVSEDIPFADDEYVTNYFGVSLTIFMSQPLEYPAEGWWTDALPQELMYDGSYAAGVINAQRSANGITPLVNATDYFISPTYDEEVDGGWQYTIEFIGLRPSEIQLLLTTLGGAQKYFPDATLTYMPLLRRGFSTWSDGDTGELTVDLNGEAFTVEFGESMASIRERAITLLEEIYGQQPLVDISMGQYSYADGSAGADLSIYVELPAG